MKRRKVHGGGREVPQCSFCVEDKDKDNVDEEDKEDEEEEEGRG